MKKASVILVMVMVGILESFALVQAGEVDRAAFYQQCIDQKIAQYEQKTKLVNARGENLQTCGRDAMEQLRFYENHKDQLVRKMSDQNVATRWQQVNYYLIRAYKDHSEGSFAAR
jgi:hypothetical protein